MFIGSQIPVTRQTKWIVDPLLFFFVYLFYTNVDRETFCGNPNVEARNRIVSSK